MELYDEELEQETCALGIHTMAPLEPVLASPGAMITRVEKTCAGLLRARKLPVLIGGEHTIAVGCARALARALRKTGRPFSILQLDAHADMRRQYQGTSYNHACTGRRLSELASVVQVGVRSFCREEADEMPLPGVSTWFAADIAGRTGWAREVNDALDGEVYISLDLDVFDPSLVPAVGTPEPGGLGWREVMGLLRAVSRRHRIAGLDMSELTPIAGNPASDFFAAKTLYRIIGYALESRDAPEGGEETMAKDRDKGEKKDRKKAKLSLKEKRRMKKEKQAG